MKEIKLDTKLIDVDIKLRGHVTIVIGDTATGKSFIANILSRNVENCLAIGYSDVENKTKKDLILKSIVDVKGKLIIIDQADDVFRCAPELIKFINNDLDNTFIVIGRNTPIQYQISWLSKLNIENGVARLEYLEKNPRM